MGRQFKNEGFGVKGLKDQAASLSEALLSGKPLGRSARGKELPKLKPRTKPKFGRRANAPVNDNAMTAFGRAARRGWMLWVALAAVVLLGAQALAGYGGVDKAISPASELRAASGVDQPLSDRTS